MNFDLFKHAETGLPEQLCIGPGAVYLSEFLIADDAALIRAVEEVVKESPFRHLTTPGGKRMSVAMSNCGALGWVSDQAGYRYQAIYLIINKIYILINYLDITVRF